MKKRISFILAVVMIMAVMIPAIPVSVAAETTLTTSTTNTYTKTANPIEISTAADYKAFYADLISGNSNVLNKKVVLKYDIVLNEDTTGDWYNDPNVNPLATVASKVNPSTWAAFTGEFDGQGHTIKGVYLHGSYMGPNAAALFPQTNTGANIHSFTLDGFYMNLNMSGLTSYAGNSSAAVAAITGRSTNELTLDGITIKNGVIKASNVTALDTAGSKGGVNVGAVIGVFRVGNDDLTPSINMTNVIVEDSVTVVGSGATTDYKGGMIGAYNYGTDTKMALAFDVSGSSITPIGPTALDAIGTMTGTNPEMREDTYSVAYTGQSTQTGEGDKSVKTYVLLAKLNAAFRTVGAYGGGVNTYAYDATNAAVMTITTATDYQNFFRDITTIEKNGYTYAGKTVKLANDIVFNDTTDENWYTNADVMKLTQLFDMTGSWNKQGFNGTFDGQGYTLKGVYIDVSYSYYKTAGLFPTANNATISHLNIDGFYVFNDFNKTTSNSIWTYGRNGTGALVGTAFNSITIDNVTIKNGTVTSEPNCGTQTDFKSLSMGSVIGAYYYLDTASTDREITITNTTVTNDVVLSPATGTTAVCGGIIGEYWFGDAASISAKTIFDLSGSLIVPKNADTLNPIGGFYAKNSDMLNRTDDAYQVKNTTNNKYDVSETYTALADLNDAIANSGAYNPDQRFYGIQRKTDGTEGLRLIALVKIEDDYTSFDNLGFAVKVGDDSGNVDISKAYTSILADGKPVNAPEGYYFYTYVLTEITDGTVLEFSTYAVKDGVTYTSNVYTYTY